MRVRGFCCGWIGMDFGGLIEGEIGRLRIPIPAYLIEHEGSVIVFDAGLHPDLRDDESARYQKLSEYFDFDLPTGTDLRERLEACNIDPSDVDLMILSHMHFDHVGGSALVRGAELVVQRAEWLAALADVNGEHYTVADIDLGRRLHLLDGEWDIFGDGRVIVQPATGHTAGLQSLRLRTDEGEELILCSDACYLRRSLESLALPPYSFDAAAQVEVLKSFQLAEFDGARLIFGHDPAQWPSGPDDDRIVELAGPYRPL